MFKRRNVLHWLLTIFTLILTSGYVQASDPTPAASPQTSARKILVVMTNHSAYPTRTDKTGLWFTELTEFFDVIQAAGLQMDFVSPEGGAIPLDDRSMKSFYLNAAARKHLADPAFMARLKATVPASSVDPTQYQAIYYTGGHGTMWDFPDNKDLKKISEQIYRQGGIVTAVCHGVAGLLPLQDDQGQSLIAGRKVTGFSNTEEWLAGIKSQVPFFLQDELVKRGAHYQKAFFPFTAYAVADDRIITGQNPQSGGVVAIALLKRLKAEK
ncbi:type 1 glutamine amidotransferase domain-containing protein [Aquirhabdus sp.]|uniref:type 1 glutamine amidotransferase domain-containing protein n=1 Tax=Aquirhabdus sp. TaxID=2824160 RepID=UPI00396C91EB